MAITVGRREFITLLGAAGAVPMIRPRESLAQQSMVVVGWLHGGAPQLAAPSAAAFHEGIHKFGYVEGRNLAIVFRGTEQFDRLPAFAAELVGLPASILVATGTISAARAAKAATKSIPIVFTTGGDPVDQGLVASMNRPGGNATGVSFLTGSLVAKRLELLRELIPKAGTIAFLANPGNERSEADIAQIQTAARNIALKIVVIRARAAPEIDGAVATAAGQKVDAIVVASDAFFNSRREQLATLAARYRIPASYASREYVRAGGLMSYGDDREDTYRLAGRYVGRILKGEKPADLPVLQPTKFEFVINLKAAKALGITFPPSFHLRADEVIE